MKSTTIHATIPQSVLYDRTLPQAAKLVFAAMAVAAFKDHNSRKWLYVALNQVDFELLDIAQVPFIGMVHLLEKAGHIELLEPEIDGWNHVYGLKALY